MSVGDGCILRVCTNRNKSGRNRANTSEVLFVGTAQEQTPVHSYIKEASFMQDELTFAIGVLMPNKYLDNLDQLFYFYYNFYFAGSERELWFPLGNHQYILKKAW